ncbi:hypothetical protein ACOSQ2_008207 [Xanthoceras sorbifolium]
MVGDFNEIVCNFEKRGGRFNFSKNGFSEWINCNGLVDMGFIGQNFTWMTKRGIGEEIWYRLDRALWSMDWRLNYVKGFMKNLPRINSDHCPLLIHLASKHIPDSKNKPFRFEAMWLKHSMFNKLVSDSCNQERVSISSKVGRLTEVLNKWNKEDYGCVFRNKRRIIARIQGV